MMSPPRPWAVMTAAACLDTRNEPRAMTSCWISQSARVVSSSGLEIDRPALLTTRSIPPNASAATANASATPASSVTSEVTPTATSAEPLPAAAIATSAGRSPVADPTPTPGADPTSTAVADPTSTAVADPTPTPGADPTSTAVADPTPTPGADPTSTAVADPTPAAGADPTPAAEPSSAATVCAAAPSRSATTTHAPSTARRWAVARPMPDPPPVTRAIRPASGLGAGRRRSLASSSSQYSMRNFSLSGIGSYEDTASAPRITLIAFR